MHSKRALVVGGPKTSGAIAETLLRQFGVSIVKASTGAEAVQRFEEDSAFDLVVMSLEMSGLDAFALTRMIRKYQVAKRPYIVGASSKVDMDVNEKAKKAGMDGFMIFTQPQVGGGAGA